METKHDTWRSPSLGRSMTIRIYGDSGTPVIGLPTRGKDAGQWERRGAINAISHQLEQGYNQLYCLETVDGESFLADEVLPAKRLMRYRQYEAYVIEEVVPYIRQRNNVDYLMVAGMDLGGYHAVNLALKHPLEFDKAIGISGLYDIKSFFGDFYSEDLYFNNPIDYVPNLNKQPLLNKIRSVDFRLVTYKEDPRRQYAEKLARIFRTKFIDHKLDVWNLPAAGEWDTWSKMIRTHII